MGAFLGENLGYHPRHSSRVSSSRVDSLLVDPRRDTLHVTVQLLRCLTRFSDSQRWVSALAVDRWLHPSPSGVPSCISTRFYFIRSRCTGRATSAEKLDLATPRVAALVVSAGGPSFSFFLTPLARWFQCSGGCFRLRVFRDKIEKCRNNALPSIFRGRGLILLRREREREREEIFDRTAKWKARLYLKIWRTLGREEIIQVSSKMWKHKIFGWLEKLKFSSGHKSQTLIFTGTRVWVRKQNLFWLEHFRVGLLNPSIPSSELIRIGTETSNARFLHLLFSVLLCVLASVFAEFSHVKIEQ